MPGFSQGIRINPKSYTADELVNKVLINSPCVSGANVVVKTGTDFGSTNGVGYFENDNPNFPFEKGVVLTTGDISKTPSPNNVVLSDGSLTWTGDSDLESNLLSQSGIIITSINSSSIEFDFQPKTPNFDFAFIFASEEYGTSQCNYSDAFAFLLRDVTAGDANVNLAIVPSTANTPISVETIRDDKYNNNCASANPTFFGSFNGPGFGPAINFNGQTVKMTASAVGLDVTHIYHIKIVIADGGSNPEYDSAIFLEANTFNIGQNVLGLDYTVENNKAVCAGQNLPTLSASGLTPGTTFQWKRNGLVIPGQNKFNLDLNTLSPVIESGLTKISVTYTEPDCVAVSDEIDVEIYPSMGVANTIPNIFTCDSGASNYNFDLSKNTPIIMSGQDIATTPMGILDDLPIGTRITYHNSNSDASNDVNALSNQISITKAENNKTIYARIESPTTPCYEIRSFQLQIVPSPIISIQPLPVTLCGRNFTDVIPKATFNLSGQRAQILGTQDPNLNLISFHNSLSGADNNNDLAAVMAGNMLTTETKTIFVRIQNITNTSCYVTTSFELIVSPSPKVDVLEDVIVCAGFKLPPLSYSGSEYWTGPNATGFKKIPNDIINTNSTIYVHNVLGLCKSQDPFNVTIADIPSITPPSATYCTEFKLPTLAYGKYYTKSGGTNTIGNIELPAGTSINSTGINTIYVWFEDTINKPTCTKEQSFKITIVGFIPLQNYPNQFSCNPYVLPPTTDGGVYYSGPNKGLPIIKPGTLINTTQKIYVFKENGSGANYCSSEKSFTIFISLTSITPPTDVDSCSSYILPEMNVGEYRTAAAGGGISVAAGTSIDKTTTLWFYVEGQTCTYDIKFTITVRLAPIPKMEDLAPVCDIYYLPKVEHNGSYYSAANGFGKKLFEGYPVTSSSKIYFYEKDPNSNCFVEEKFLVTIYKSPSIDARPVEVINCNKDHILDDLTNGEYYEFSGGASDKNPILPAGYAIKNSKKIYVYASAPAPNTCVSEYSINVEIIDTRVKDIADQYGCDSFNLPAIEGLGDYYTAPDGPNGSGIKLSAPFTPILTNTTMYVYAENNQRVKCSNEDTFNIIIYNKPIVSNLAAVKYCESYTLPSLVAPATKYFQNPGGPNATNSEKIAGDIINTSTTIYAYAETGTATTKICFDEKPLVITIIPKPKPILTIPSICYDRYNGITETATVISGYDPAEYALEWKSEDGTLKGVNTNFATNVVGNYTLKVTNISATGCSSDEVPFSIQKSSSPEKIDYVVSNWFSENQTITVNTKAIDGFTDNFIYYLDGVPQTSNVFTNVSSGSHKLEVGDANGCDAISIPISIFLINNPKFFSPNGDNINDTWGIVGLELQSNAKIFIYDRYGRLVKEMSTNETWDGMLNNQYLPADDYWFTVTYDENGNTREYKSHFSLIR